MTRNEFYQLQSGSRGLLGVAAWLWDVWGLCCVPYISLSCARNHLQLPQVRWGANYLGKTSQHFQAGLSEASAGFIHPGGLVRTLQGKGQQEQQSFSLLPLPLLEQQAR